MNQDTKSKFAAILEAAQAKTKQQTTVNFTQPKAAEVRQHEPIQLPVNNLPELSAMTFDDLIAPAPQQNNLTIVDYSDRSFAIVTAVKPSEDILNIFRLHGTFNANLKCGKGWIFSKRHLEAIKAKLSL